MSELEAAPGGGGEPNGSSCLGSVRYNQQPRCVARAPRSRVATEALRNCPLTLG
jgi:hypothetical protein